LIVLGDWVSYYLAVYNKKDPIVIKNIDYLKSELAKLQ
ncbi:MAG TPA: bifunctional phosphoglucose/phosphomannose isomerase, partial [Caldithrix sp.]|nr:bifunctional phosphoglucose/phosphomannose isomerase [Caldithrix sp.]